jgi:galactose mutarotase-like enzyme
MTDSNLEPVTLGLGDTTAEVVPARGALVTALRVGTTDVLYLDRATLADPTKNVRGGIPVLFPFAGKLADGTFALAGTKMKQHGFGRDRAWTVTERDAASVRMTLAADADTHAQYPYAFTAHHTVMLVPRGVQLELTIVAADQPLPVSPGWHPYFALAAADKSAVRGDVVTPEGFGDDREFDFGIRAPTDGRARFSLPGRELRLDASPELRHLQFWSQPGKPFICIEPFFGPAGTINTERRGWVPAGEARTYWMRIRLG